MKMKQVNFLRTFTVSSFLIALLMTSCSGNKGKEATIIGEWQALWQTSVDENMKGMTDQNLQMNGLITFMEDGKVEISAYGYDGCIFYEDTLMNTLTWKINESELRFIDQGDDQGLPYTINKFSADELHLTLLEDINLTLSRN